MSEQGEGSGGLHRRLKRGESLAIGDGVRITAIGNADLLVAAPKDVPVLHQGIDGEPASGKMPAALEDSPVG